jgi:hypothetical protein
MLCCIPKALYRNKRIFELNASMQYNNQIGTMSTNTTMFYARIQHVIIGLHVLTSPGSLPLLASFMAFRLT